MDSMWFLLNMILVVNLITLCRHMTVYSWYFSSPKQFASKAMLSCYGNKARSFISRGECISLLHIRGMTTLHDVPWVCQRYPLSSRGYGHDYRHFWGEGCQMWTGQRSFLSAPDQESITEEALVLWNRQNFAWVTSKVTRGKRAPELIGPRDPYWEPLSSQAGRQTFKRPWTRAKWLVLMFCFVLLSLAGGQHTMESFFYCQSVSTIVVFWKIVLLVSGKMTGEDGCRKNEALRGYA